MTVSVSSPLRPGRHFTPAIRFGTRSAFLLFLTTIFGVAAFLVLWLFMPETRTGLDDSPGIPDNTGECIAMSKGE